MERMAMELQKKVIMLQQERDRLEEQLMRGAPISITSEMERRQNLELKEEITRLTEAGEESRSENSRLIKQLEESENLCFSLTEQLKEFIQVAQPSGQKEPLPGSDPVDCNKTDLQKAGKEEDEEDDEYEDAKSTLMHEEKWTQTEKAEETGIVEKKRKKLEKEQADKQTLLEMESLREQLKKLEAENLELTEQVKKARHGTPESSSSDEEDSVQHKPKRKVQTLERQLQVLHSENLRLADKLGGYSPRSQQDSDEIIERIVELEDFCTELQDHVREAEGHERQTREKLRLAEQTINELELSEAQYRDRCDELSRLERETKKQLNSLQTTGRELREIIMDRDIVEQALREKVEFLEKVEAQSSQHIAELEALEKSLREQLQSRDSPTNGADHPIPVWKDKLAAAEREIQHLRERNNELEENEEILRENWRRVADEDSNRISSLEQKIHILDGINQDLKSKLSEADDFVVINAGPSQGSLAEELSASSPASKARPLGENPLSDEDSGDEAPKKELFTLKRQLSYVKEEKNTKIANLQERVAKMKENEIKLSETLAEMEMTERELRAKLALYECSEVTVEKMLKYQDKIHELRTSQESLLDQLETMESQEETLQERLEETERRLKGKIVTLEVEMKTLKQKEHKGNARIRELEKHEEELMEKTKKQADKENGLYVRISGLMDQVKEHKTKISDMEKKLAEKDERCRKVASLETKFLQIEGAYREKVTALESSLTEAQSSQAEQDRQYEEAVMSLGEQVAHMEASLEAKEKEHSQRVAILDETFAEKEKDFNRKTSALESSLAERDRTIANHDKELSDKDASMSQLERELSEKDASISELERALSEKKASISELEKELSEKDTSISELERELSEKNTSVSELERELSERDAKISELDRVMSSRDAEGSELEKNLSAKDSRISELERDLSEKASQISVLEKSLSEKDLHVSKLEKDLSERVAQIGVVEKKLSDKDSHVSKLEKDLSERESRVSDMEKELSEQQTSVSDLERTLKEKVSFISELETKLSKMESHISEAEQDLTEFNLMKEKFGEKDNRIGELEEDLRKKASQISELEQNLGEKMSQISQQEKDMEEKDSQICQLEKEVSEKRSHLAQLEEDVLTKDKGLCEVDNKLSDRDSRISRLETQARDKDSHVQDLEAQLQDKAGQIRDLEKQLKTKDSEHSDRLEKAQHSITAKDSHIAQIEERIVEMSSTISELLTQVGKKDAHMSSLEQQLSDKDVVVSERVSHLQTELESKQKSSTDRISSLEGELTTTKSELSQVESKLAESSRQLEQVQSELEQERNRLNAVTESKEVLEAEKERLQSETTSKDSELEARLREQDENFQTKLSARESEFQQACSSLDVECENLRKELLEKDAVIEKLESNKNELLSKIENLKDREKHLTGELSILETDFHSLHAEKEEEMKRAVASMQSKLKDTEQEKYSAEDKQSSLEADVHSLKQTIEKQSEEMTRLESALHKASSEAQTLQGKLSELQHDEEKSSTQADTLLQQEVMLKARVSQVEAELHANTKNLDTQKQSFAETIQEKQDLETALLKVQTDLSDSHVLNARLQDNVSELTSLTKSLREELAKVTAELRTHEAQEQELQDLLEREKKNMVELESQIGSLKDEKLSALEEVERLRSELEKSTETTEGLESQIHQLNKSEESLKAEVAAERSAKQDLDDRLSQASHDATVKQERVTQLERVAVEKEEEIERVKVDLVSHSQQQVTSQAAEKDREMESVRQREKALQDRVASLETQMGRRQDDHSHMCQKLQDLEKREKELLEQITDIERTVIVPLERENSDLKEELECMKQQNESLNLQVDKQEERAREDAEELDALRKSVADIQLSRTDVQSKLNTLTQELKNMEAEKETLKGRLAELTTLNENLEGQLENNRVEMDKIELDLSKEMCSRDAQTDWDMGATEAEHHAVQDKLTVLQDAESRFMSRIMDLEEREQQLSEELVSARQASRHKDLCERQTQTEAGGEDMTLVRQSSVSSVDACVETDDLQEANTAKVPELFARVQELESANHTLSTNLESANQKLSTSVEHATVGETERKQMTEKLRLLEQAEDRLMERVMELEENEVTLRTQIDRSRHRAKAADELEEELSVLLQQEDDLKEKLADLTLENSTLSQTVDSLKTQLSTEKTMNESLAHQVETEQRQLKDAQKELRLVQTKLQTVRSEYEEKLSALEDCERQTEKELDAQTQQDSDLRQQIQVLKEEMEDVCERYKELEHENSGLKHENSGLKEQHSKVLLHLQQAESRCMQLSGDLSSESTIQLSKASTQLSTLPRGATVSTPTHQKLSEPQVCSNSSIQMVQSSPHGAQNSESSNREESLLAKISELEKELAEAHQGMVGGVQSAPGSVTSEQEEQGDSDSSGVHSGLSQPLKVLSLHEALKENASLKAQVQDLQARSDQSTSSGHQGVERKVSAEKQSADVLQLQAEISRLQAKVGELEKSLSEAEGAVQEVVTVVRTRSVHTLEQKIETIQHTIHTQSPAWSLHQELLELLTSQADLQKQVSHLMETEHNLRSALKQTEEELSKAKSGAGTTTLGARRPETDRRLSLQSRLSRFGGGITASRSQGDTDKGRTDSDREKQQWLERQVADLQLAKTNLERRLHEAERRLAFRPRPTAASREELQFRLEKLQGEQGEWRRKVEDLEALNSHYLKEKLELAHERNALEHKLQEQGLGVNKDVNVVFVGGRREDPLGSSGSVSEGESLSAPSSPTTTADTMLEKPEDVLHKRIKELENLESYLRQQLNEVESDRDQLHEITRKDKATIHELNVRLRELMLTERNLRSQVTGLEDSERSLYNRCSEHEDNVARLEDRVHELEVHERRLRELVRKLKLDEEVWLSKSGDLATSMEHLSTTGVTLRKTVQDLQLEKGGLSDRAEYLEVRVKELENLETTLVQKLKNHENVEASLHNRLQQFEKSEAAAYSKASELDMINMDLSSRLQRAVEENAVLSQHVAQQQGQIHELDRKLTAASDAEVSLNQHVDSLQKSEASLQRKTREYELRDIDAQARIRELEQTDEILKDKVNQLQRSENRLKSRLVEFETVGSQMLGSLPASQKQQLPQKLEECQKRVVILQRQLEAAKAELHRPQPAEEDVAAVKVPTATLTAMRVKVALLEDTEYQLSELEELNAQLSQNILQLQQGKGSCGHEVELEVLRKRLESYQNLIQKLKHHLSEGQVPSLWAADIGQGSESEDLPARNLQSLESERVLHSVRSLTKPPGLTHTQEGVVQAERSSTVNAGRAQGVTPGEPEESHWRRVELRRQSQAGAEQRGASASMPHATATTTSTLPLQEELVIGLSLASESERSSFKSQNDTDSEMSGAPTTPRLRVIGSTQRGTSSSVTPAPVAVPSSGSGRGTDSHPPPMPTATSAWSSPSSPIAPQRKSKQQRTSSGFVTDDSFYLPSSAPSESESVEDDEAPPLPSSAPPGHPMSSPPSPPSRLKPQAVSTAPVTSRTFVSSVSLPLRGQSASASDSGGGEAGAGGGQKGRQSSVVGMTIRQRIAQIEKQLKDKPSSKAGSKAEDEDVFNWKANATENARLLGLAEREGKQLKDDINRLEKDLEEKRRYIDIFEKWILDADEILKNKNKKNDRDLVQHLQTEVKHLKQDLSNAGYRKDDIFTDPAALKTELDRKERELSAKRTEVETLVGEMQRWQQECSNVEMMRRSALDSLRLLETEVTQLQDADVELKQMKDDYNTLRGQTQKIRELYEENLSLHERMAELQHRMDRLRETRRDMDNMCARYDEVVVENNKAVSAVHSLRAKVARLSKKCQEKDEMLRRLSEELRRGRGRSGSLMEELTRLEAMAAGEEYNRPMSPLDLIAGPASSVETERLLSERVPQATPFNRWASASSLGDPYDASTGNDLLHGADRSSLQRPRSAEQVRRGSGHATGVGSALGYAGETLCVAILDYQPDAASCSGHRSLELPLKEGDKVRIRGPVDRHGYCEAEVGGHTGLVPASHLYPLTDTSPPFRLTHQYQGRHKNSGENSAEQIVEMFDDLQDPRLLASLNHNHNHSPQPAKRHGHTTATQTRQRRSQAKSNAAPEPPSNLHIEEVEGNSLVLAWQPPPLDQHGCSNGSKVVGYRIYLNGRVCQQPHSPKLSCTRVEGIRHDRSQQLAIQTLAASGQVSSRVELLYQGMTAPPSANKRADDGETDTDLSSILNSIHYKTGRKRMVMGLYDYDPEKQSPGDFTACELAFNAGDILTVYGEERQDGFFHGERNGQRGLVPACFVEPVTQGVKSTQKHSPINGASTSGNR
ncbi:golgin subfamily B member 1-like isoform X2 [Littorina saxatilis]|uniref:golgin subfamily B member 1-like isoform X2 n=1 Tax=Littorina saxatilis TaxID=31220 RepID=UPI0038B501E3